MKDTEWLNELASRLVCVPGVEGVMLGGSRARGEHVSSSDYDLGLYYRPPLDIAALGLLARAVAGAEATVTEPGDWGPWVDGGAWLNVDGISVDWIYRRIDRVRSAWGDAQQGRYAFNAQPGHPFGLPDFAYPGEVALGVVLQDPTGFLGELQQHASSYPPALADELVARLWEAQFLIGGARKAGPRADSVWVAGCLFRVVMLCAHALHGRAGRWLINEKGAVASAGQLANSPANFAERAQAIFGGLGCSASELASALDAATDLVDATKDATR